MMQSVVAELVNGSTVARKILEDQREALIFVAHLFQVTYDSHDDGGGGILAFGFVCYDAILLFVDNVWFLMSWFSGSHRIASVL